VATSQRLLPPTTRGEIRSTALRDTRGALVPHRPDDLVPTSRGCDFPLIRSLLLLATCHGKLHDLRKCWSKEIPQL
jgi:hypothetical protein